MKTYDCEWCSAETNREEKGAHVLENGEMLCSKCYSDPEILRYFPIPTNVIIDIQKFEDVLDALRIKYSGHEIGIKGDHKLLRLFLDMSECVDNT